MLVLIFFFPSWEQDPKIRNCLSLSGKMYHCSQRFRWDNLLTASLNHSLSLSLRKRTEFQSCKINTINFVCVPNFSCCWWKARLWCWVSSSIWEWRISSSGRMCSSNCLQRLSGCDQKQQLDLGIRQRTFSSGLTLIIILC